MSEDTRTLWDRIQDATVVRAFDASGFRRHQRRFDEHALHDDLRAHVALVTGANAGIGRATALELARRGATVHLLCRNPARGAAAESELRTQAGHDRIHAHRLDVSDLDAVQAFLTRFDGERVDTLVHNAGVLPDVRTASPQGHEATWATHIVGPLALTQGLLPALERGAGRIVWVSSGGMYLTKLDLFDLDWTRRRYDGVAAYAQTKRMQVVLSAQLATRLPGGVTSHAMHPGWADTRSVRESLPRFHRVTAKILRTAEQGADTIVYLAAARTLSPATGGFWFDRRAVSPELVPGTATSPALAAEFAARAAADAGVDPALVTD